jgi:hypothetical protein
MYGFRVLRGQSADWCLVKGGEKTMITEINRKATAPQRSTACTSEYT